MAGFPIPESLLGIPAPISGLRFPLGLVGYENGLRWSDWVTSQGGGGAWSIPAIAGATQPVLTWKNNAGASRGLAAHWVPYSSHDLAATGDFEDEHAVHLRITSKGNAADPHFSMGPATSIDSAAGDGYAVILDRSGVPTPQLKIVRLDAHAFTVLSTIDQAVPPVDSVVSITYRWDTSTAEAQLGAMVDGELVGTVTDTGPAAHRMSTVSGRMGIVGSDDPSIPNSAAIGDFATEWWATNEWASFTVPESLAQQQGSTFSIQLLRRQRFLDDPQPTIAFFLLGELVELQWSNKRIGGSAALKARIKFPLVVDDPTDPLVQVNSDAIDNPKTDTWESSDWIGGELVLTFNYASNLLEDGTPFLESRDPVWRGRVSEVRYTPETDEVDLQAEGLFTDFDRVSINVSYENQPIRTILVDLVDRLVSKGVRVPTFGKDTYVRYNPAKIVGLQSTLDQRISVEFQHVNAMAAIETLMAYLPPGATWGVDVEGDFYLDQQTPHYTADSSGIGVQNFSVENDAVQFSRTTSIRRVVTSRVVYGRNFRDGETRPGSAPGAGGNVGRVFGVAHCERASMLFGKRNDIVTDGSIPDAGFAQKIAVATLKRDVLPATSARLRVVTPLIEEKEFWQATVRGAPRIAVQDRSSAETSLRLLGDELGYSNNHKGTAGDYTKWTSKAIERTRDKSWLLHAALRFDYAATTGKLHFLFGRPNGSTATRKGWGFLTWDGTGGLLQWNYTTNGGSSVRLFSTGITVPVAGSGTVVHFTVWRDAGGTFRFYNGNVLTRTESAFTADVLEQSLADDWRAHALPAGHSLPAPQDDGDVAIENVWLFDTSDVESQDSGVTGLIASANALRLPINRALGLLFWAPMDKPTASLGVGTFQHYPVYRDGATTDLAELKRTGAASTGDGAPISSDQRRGHEIGDGEKKFGGPFIFDAETTTYRVDGATGILVRDYNLGELPVDVFTTLSAIRDKLRHLENENARSERV